MANGEWSPLLSIRLRPSPSHLELECRHEVPRPAAGGDEDGVGAQGLVDGPGGPAEPGAGGAREAAALRGVDGLEGVVHGPARLDLDEGDGVAPAHDDVDLAARRAE